MTPHILLVPREDQTLLLYSIIGPAETLISLAAPNPRDLTVKEAAARGLHPGNEDAGRDDT
jgi:hypothetical protein